MKDRIVEFPNRYHLAKVDGTDDIYDLEPAPGEITEKGTFLNKENLLADATATAVKALVENASTPETPNETFSLLATAVAEGAKIQTGSYVGTGTYGADNPCSITFDFEPYYFRIFATKDSSWFYWKSEIYSSPNQIWIAFPFIMTDETTYYWTYNASSGQQRLVLGVPPADKNSGYIATVRNGNSLQWYSTYRGESQHNGANTTYYWLAIG